MLEEKRQNLRIGTMVIVSLVVLGVGIFVIGKRQQFFIRHTNYHSVFRDVLGLQPGAPVQLNGVTVGYVKAIELPVKAQEEGINVRFTVDARYMDRIRRDTVASIKTAGLLGDRFLKLSGGSPGAARVLEGGLVTGKNPAELEHFLAGGEDLMENLLAISSSLRTILERAETGKGLLGQLLAPSEEGQAAGTDLVRTIAALRRITEGVEAGHGLAGRLVADDATGSAVFDNLAAAAAAIRSTTEGLAKDMARNDTAWATLLRDPRGAKLAAETLQSLHDASQALAAAAGELASGKGTLPRLLKDKEYADQFLNDLQSLIHSLQSISGKIDRGEGTVGGFVNDPQMYLDLQNVVHGVKESGLSSWYIRNRKAAGERAAEKEVHEMLQTPFPTPTPVHE